MELGVWTTGLLRGLHFGWLPEHIDVITEIRTKELSEVPPLRRQIQCPPRKRDLCEQKAGTHDPAKVITP